VKVKLITRFSLFFATLLLSCNVFAFSPDGSGIGVIRAAELPPEARQTIVLIRQGGPFPYEKDGSVFGNYEKVLPLHRRGYYREFTVKTPRARNRGARRIIAGGEKSSPREYYYTADHYRSFKRVME
jgi:ribonuclease T1